MLKNLENIAMEVKGFKMTEIGPLPEDWKVVRLGNYCRVFSGYAFKSSDFVDFGIMVVKIGNLQNGTIIIDKRTSYFPSQKVTKQIEKYRLHEGDVLIALTGATTGKIAVVPKEFEGSLLNQRVGKFEIFNKNLNKDFFRYLCLLTFFQKKIKENILQSAQGNISPKQIEQIFIPLPPLPEQKAIARVLKTIQDAIEATEKVIAAVKELKKSLMRHLFTYGPVPVSEKDRVRLKQTEIGPIPEDWKVVRLGEVFTLRKGVIDSQTIPNIKYVGLEHLNPGEIKIKRWGISNLVKSTKSLFKKGDILFNKLRPYLDKAALAEWDGICSTDILVLVPGEKILPLFAVYLMHYQVVYKEAVATMSGVNHPRTSWKALKQILIPLPSLSIQQKIAQILKAVDDKISAEEKKKKALQDFFKTMLHHLMTGKIRVKGIGVNYGC